MKVGDLCRVTRRGTHVKCQYGDYVVLLRPINRKRFKTIFWETINQKTGKCNHHHIDDLEVI